MIEKIYTELKQAMDELVENHEKFMEKGNKSAAQRARKSASKVKNLITPYKKANMDKAS